MESIEIQKKYLTTLQNIKQHDVEVLLKKAYRGIWETAIKKYSDSAHFVYELLQNADDAKATWVEFIIEEEGLWFKHNGTVRFSISDPENEDSDTENNRLGHINAITSIGNSTKYNGQAINIDEQKIGKFGIGFKAVFAYSQTPHIYDDTFNLKLENYIVPIEIVPNDQKRLQGETLFYFPFNRRDKPKEKAFSDILQKLKTLTHPVLFLNNLNEITWKTDTEDGKYTKKIKQDFLYESINVQLISLFEKTEKNIWLFTREIQKEGSIHKYSVGFFLNADMKIDTNKPYAAFCFFPTNVNTNLKFIIQAPFLLTENREGIVAGDDWNRLLVDKLAHLAADSLLILKEVGIKEKTFLIDDNLVKLIPYKASDFTNVGDRDRISFRPFYDSIQKKLQTEKLLPGIDGTYSSKNLSYWASDTELPKIFSDIQIASIMAKPDVRWIFPTIGRKDLANTDSDLVKYIDGGNERMGIESNLIITNLSPDKILTKINAAFIEKQSVEWLNEFYIYLSDKPSYCQTVKKVPIFINGEGRASAAYNDSNDLVLFKPSSENDTEYPISNYIHKDFLHYPKSIEFFVEIFKIDSPSLKDEIYKILPLYKEGFTDIEKIKVHFVKFFKYFELCPSVQQPEYLERLKQIPFLACQTKDNPDVLIFKKPDDCYFPDKELIFYFEGKKDTPFVDIKFYEGIIEKRENDSLGIKNASDIKIFFSALEINRLPIIRKILLNISEEKRTYMKIATNFTRYSRVLDKSIDGAKELIWYITRRKVMGIEITNLTEEVANSLLSIENKDYVSFLMFLIEDTELPLANDAKEKSIALWNILILLIKKHSYSNFETLVRGKHEYFFGTAKSEEFKSEIFYYLKCCQWLINKNGERVAAGNASVNDLAIEYDTNSQEAKNLIDFLGIKNPDKNLNLSDDEKKALNMGREMLKEGITLEELAAYAKHKREKNQSNSNGDSSDKSSGTTNENSGNKENEDPNARSTEKKDTDSIPKPFIPKKPIEEIETEENELVPVMVDPKDTSKNFEKVEKEKEQEYLDEKELRRRRAEYIEIARTSQMYSFGWFKALLELEDSFTAEDRVKRNPIRIVFNKAKLEEDGTLLLYDTPYIPLIDDMGEFQIIFYYGSDSEEKKTVLAEVVSPQKDKVVAKLKKPEALDGFDLSIITKAVVEVSNADFILEKLKNAFKRLQYADTDKLCSLLPNSLSFVFGPPGTGKTTYLSWMVGGLNPEPLTLAGKPITPLMEYKDNKILVLTPTNKAADVLVEKIIENYTEAERYDYQDWLIRFGETKSDALMNSGLFIKDRKVPSTIYNKCTFVTTIARFPYDNFKVVRKNKEDDKWEIKYFDWDYIIFDEASMISLASIVYVIYQASKVNPNVKFIIGGDPFQIHPIIQFKWEGWSFIKETGINKEGQSVEYEQDAGNIYSMVGLISDKSFINPQTIPHPFPVHNLTKQFRSIEPIGALFSNYRYHGKLQHDRIPERILLHPKKDIKKITVHNLPLKPITIIHFPVEKYERIYRSRSIKGSPYHLYAAIFIVEMLKYMQENGTINPDSKYKIGVICPYKIQESIINNLVGKTCQGKIEIVTGTVHGFQGDQCDMIIMVFNPPAKITRSTRSFLNKKNILNVAISRARDCLIILVPENQEGDIKVEDLHQIERIKDLARRLPETKEHLIEYRAKDLEGTLFKNGERIKNFAIPFSHQNINVYQPSKIKYEIRIDENAIDINLE